MKNQKRAEEIAVERMKMLGPLLEEGYDKAKVAKLKQEICEKYGISDRTLRRYLLEYRKSGFSGLKPKQTGRPGVRSIPDEILKEAIHLRREVPGRSVDTIIKILEWEKRVEPGAIKRSTLQEHLAREGYSSSQMRIYRESAVAARRFQKSSRNSLWQSDIKFGPYINGEQVYLVAFIDDCTRFVLHAEFYPVLDASIVEDAFRQALIKFGAPKRVYFDNGKQFRTKVMERACAKLGIRLLFARPYAAESKGKIERLNRTIDSFLSEVKIEELESLVELNRKFWVWLDECYLYRPHSSLKDNMSPVEAYNKEKEPLRFLETEEIGEAFLRMEKRKVDKSGCISFNGEKYEIENGLLLVGRKVDVIYERSDAKHLWIEHENFKRTTAKPLEIGEWAGQRPPLPQMAEAEAVTKSRLLDAAEKRNQNRDKLRKGAISFRIIGGSTNV